MKYFRICKSIVTKNSVGNYLKKLDIVLTKLLQTDLQVKKRKGRSLHKYDHDDLKLFLLIIQTVLAQTPPKIGKKLRKVLGWVT